MVTEVYEIFYKKKTISDHKNYYIFYISSKKVAFKKANKNVLLKINVDLNILVRGIYYRTTMSDTEVGQVDLNLPWI